MTAQRPSGGTSPASSLAIIRLAMLLGVLVFGAVIWWMRRGEAPPSVEPSVERGARMLAMVWIAVSVTGIAGPLAVAGRQAAEAKRRSLSIVAWALGEGAALAGGVVYLLLGDARWYLGGLFVLLASFIVFPARRRE